MNISSGIAPESAFESEPRSFIRVRAAVTFLPQFILSRALPSSLPLRGHVAFHFQIPTIALLILVGACICPLLSAQVSQPIPWTEQLEFRSNFTSRQYLIQVGLPRNYDPTQRNYPVVYQLDGISDFAKTLTSSRALEYDHAIPPAIVVGITYSGSNPDYSDLRARDFTPFQISGLSGSGQANRFLNTIRFEIIPLIERSYAVDPAQRILMGHSLGGLFTGYALLYSPQLFTGYVISSPSFSISNFRFVNEVASRGSGLNGRGLKVRITTGASESATHREGAQRFYDSLQALNLSNFDVALSFSPSERHSSVSQVAYSEGLPEVFQPTITPVNLGAGAPTNWFNTRPTFNHTIDKIHREQSSPIGFPTKVSILEPAGESNNGTARGVIYLLDGQWDLHLAFSSYLSLKSDSELTNLTRAAIEWEGPLTGGLKRRDFDLTPTDPAGNGDHGGGAAFRELMRDRLIPAVEAELTIDHGFRLLMASEKAGLWGLQDLLSADPQFDRYLLVSPSVDWDEDWILQLEEQRAASSAPLNAKVRIYTGAREKVSPAVANFVARLKVRQHSGLDIDIIVLENLGYAQAKLVAYHKGLRTMGR